MSVKIASLLTAFFLTAPAWASNPQSFVYQGRLMESNGSPTTGSVTLKFQIYDPAKHCLLYEESQAVDLTGTDGLFTVAVGSAPGSSKRTVDDPALPMATLLANGATAIRAPGGANCASGYVPASGDARYLRVTVTQGGTVDQLSPDQLIGAVPFATTAETLQGKQPGDFVQVRTDGGYALNQANVESVFSTTNFGKLLALLNGSGPTDLGGQRLTSVAAPVSGGDAANKDYSDTHIAGAAIAGPLSSGQVLSYNSVTQQWEPTDLPTSARMPAAVCGAGEASRWDGGTWVCIPTGGGGGGGTGTINLDNSKTVLTAGSPKVQLVNLPTAGSIELPPANTIPSTGGPIFQLLNVTPNQIPVLDATGKLVGLVPAHSGSDVFLFDNSTAAGKWAMTGGTVGPSTGTMKITTAASGGETLTGYTTAVGMTPTNHLLGYGRDNAGTAEVRVRIAQINEGAQTVTLGTAVNLPLANVEVYSTRLFGLSPTQALAVVRNMSSVSYLYPLTVSGMSVSVGSQQPFPAGCNDYTLSQDRTQAYCHDNASTTVRIQPDGTAQSVTDTSFANFIGLGQSGGMTIMGKCDYGSELLIKAVNFPGGVVAGSLNVPGTTNCSLGAPAAGSYPYLEDGAGSVWVLIRMNGTTYKVKVQYAGSLSVVEGPTAVGANYGAAVLTVNGVSYLTAGSGAGTIAEILNSGTLAASAPSLWSECYGPFLAGPNRCVTYSMKDNANFGVSFLITR